MSDVAFGARWGLSWASARAAILFVRHWEHMAIHRRGSVAFGLMKIRRLEEVLLLYTVFGIENFDFGHD